MGKKSKPPPPPDYKALATQQAQLDKSAAAEQTTTNRPDQNTPWGETKWTQGQDGKWTQDVNLNPADQALLDQNRAFEGQQQSIASGLLDKAGNTLGTPLSLEGLPQMQGYDESKLGQFGDIDLSQLPALPDSGFGAVEGVRDAMMSRLAPERKLQRDNEIQRLKNQGLPENSEAFQSAVKRLDQGDTDAQLQALLGAAGEYGNIFSRGLQARQEGFNEQGTKATFANTRRGQQMDEQGRAASLANMLRQQSLAEQQTIRQSPLDDFNKLTKGINPTMPQMPNFMGGTGFNAANMYGAGKDQYGAAMDAYNAQQAKSGGITKGLFGLAGSALGGPIGGMIGKGVAGMF